MSGRERERVRVAGIEFDPLTMTQAAERIAELAGTRPMSTVVTPNVDLVVVARRDAAFRAAIRRADLVLADGQPVVWASRFGGRSLPERVTGADLVPALVAIAAERDLGIFILARRPGVAEAAAARLRASEASVRIVGTAGPPATSHDGADAIARINAARPDILFVGMGAPDQELWLERHRDELDAGAGVAVGGSLDVAAGRVGRAPKWMQRYGLEWLYRLAREPRRLWRRYLLRDPAFIWYVIRDRRPRRRAEPGDAGRQ